MVHVMISALVSMVFIWVPVELVVFDVTNRVLVGNKCDLTTVRLIDYEPAKV